MAEVGLPPTSAQPAAHTSTHQWQSFEIRMRHRRAERCVLRAEAALEAGMEEEARAALEEARTLNPSAPEFASLHAALEQRRAVAVAAARRARARRAGAGAIAGVAMLSGLVAIWPRSQNGERIASAGAAAAAVPVRSASAAPAASGISQAASTTAQVPAPQPEATVRPEATAGDSGKAPVSPVATETPADNSTAAAASMGTATRATEPPLPIVQPEVAPSRREDPLPPVASADPPTLPPVQRVETTSVATPAPAAGADGIVKDLPSAALTAPRVPPPPPPPDPKPSAEDQIRVTLMQFEAAYSSLSASGAAAVWPSVDSGALSRAFAALESQHVSLGQCSIAVDGRSAVADCTGPTSWTPKVGGGRRSETRRWHFQLTSVNGKWRIDEAEARRPR